MSRLCRTVILVAFAVLLSGRAAFGNIIEPFVLPGIFQLWGLVAIPTTILVAVCERPFVSLAGVRTQALYHSFCANVISTLIGFLLLPLGIFAVYVFFPLWVVIAVCLSIVVEGRYYKYLNQMANRRLGWRWIAWGNVFSTAVLLGVSVCIEVISNPVRAHRVEPYWWPLILITALGATLGCMWGWRRSHRACKALLDERSVHTKLDPEEDVATEKSMGGSSLTAIPKG